MIGYSLDDDGAVSSTANYKLCVAGTREFGRRLGPFLDEDGALVVRRALRQFDGADFDEISTIVSGGARGPDQWGEAVADLWDHIGCEVYEPEWEQYATKRKAAFARNLRMAKEADGLVAFWDGDSNGTDHMIEKAQEEGLDVLIVRLDKKSNRTELLD